MVEDHHSLRQTRLCNVSQIPQEIISEVVREVKVVVIISRRGVAVVVVEAEIDDKE